MKPIHTFSTFTALACSLILATVVPTITRAETLYSVVISAKLSVPATRTVSLCHKENGSNVCEQVHLDFIQSLPLNNAALINLAIGHSPIGAAPANLALGITFGCDNSDSAHLVLYDKTASNVVAVIADVAMSDLITASSIVCKGTGAERECEPVNTSFEGFLTLTLRPLGAAGSNAITEGQIRLYTKGSIGDHGCISKASGSGAGRAEVTVNGDNKDVLIASFSLTSGKRIATISAGNPDPTPTSTTVSTGSSSSTLSGYVTSGVELHGVIQTRLIVDPGTFETVPVPHP